MKPSLLLPFSLLLTLILLLLLPPTSSQLFEDAELIKPIDTFQEIEQLRSGSIDTLTCIFYHSKKCPRCKEMVKTIEKLATNYKDIITVYDINCHTLWRDLEPSEQSQVSLCDPKNKDKLPQIQFLQVPTKKINPYTNQPMKAMETLYQGEATSFGLSDYAASMIPSFRVFLNTKKELNNFLRYKKIPNKVLLFTERTDTPILFRGLTNVFRDRVDFGEVRKSSLNEVVGQYNVDKFPLLMVLKLNEKKQYERVDYDGEFNFDKVKEFLEPYALENKVNREETSKYDENDANEDASAAIPDLKPKDFEKLVLNQERMVGVLAFKGDQGSLFEDVRRKFGSMMDYFVIDTAIPSNDKFAKETLEIKKVPSLRVFLAGQKKGKHIFDGSMDLKDFLKDISEVTEDYSTALNEKDLQMFVSSAFQEEKVPAVLFYNGKEPYLTFRVLSAMSQFTEKIKFFRYREPNEKVLKNFNVAQVPKFVMLVKPEDKSQLDKGQVQIAQYTGKFNFKDMIVFIDSIVKTETVAVKKSTKKVKELKTQEDFEKTCLKSSLCFIGFLEGENREVEKFQNKLEVFEQLRDKYSNKPVQFVWVDAICHSYLMGRVNVQEDILPQLVAFSPSKNTYVNQIGTFEIDSLSSFVDRTLKGRVETHTLKEELDIDEVNCSEVYKQREERKKKNEENKEEDDEILKEILEEERERKKQVQKELEKEKKKGKKKKGKKEEL